MTKNKRINKVGIGFVTGRKDFVQVLNAYIAHYRQNNPSNITQTELYLFVVYDLKYTKTKKENYIIVDEKIKSEFKSIYYYSSEDSLNVISKTNPYISKAELSFLFGSGYAKMRNTILYSAIVKKMDCLLFFDDDEYPNACIKKNETTYWYSQDPISCHIKYLSDYDVTNGLHCGYVSPIPQIDYNSDLTEQNYKMLIQTVSNDAVSWESLQATLRNGGIAFANISQLKSGDASEVSVKNGMKFITGGNLGFNLKDLSKIYPFYNPPGARGEDTFLSTCLANISTVRIPSYTFHDGFLKYPNIVNRHMPNKIEPVTDLSESIMHRFVDALKGWIRYKPLLMYITLDNNKYILETEQIKNKLKAILPVLSQHYGNTEFLEIATDFDKYTADVEKHYATYRKTKIIWKRLLNNKQNANVVSSHSKVKPIINMETSDTK